MGFVLYCFDRIPILDYIDDYRFEGDSHHSFSLIRVR